MPDCEKCRGWCCYRFFIPVVLSEDGVPDFDIHAKHGRVTAEDAEFMRENFVFIEDSATQGATINDHWLDSLTEEYGTKVIRGIMTCKAHDLEKGICTKYEDRPGLCQSFMCTDRELNWEGYIRQAEGLKAAGLWDRYGGELPETYETTDLTAEAVKCDCS